MSEYDPQTDAQRESQPTEPPAPEPAPADPAAFNDPFAGDATLMRVLSESGIPDDLTALLSETNQDHILGNMTEAEIWERKHNLLINQEYVESMFPPEESVLQGEFREKYFDLPGGKTSLNPKDLHAISDSMDAAYARSTRSRKGWQQEQLAKQIQETIRRDGDGRDVPAGAGGSGGGGLLSRFLGGGR